MNPSKSFPIEQSYINLAIVKAKEQYEKEKQLRGAQFGTTIMNSFEEIYSMKTVIEIKDIFKTCKNQKKQILVFGRAGIGKSTFCRYAAYQWARGSYWSQYELLVLIPLRRLTANRYPSLPLGQRYSLIDLVKQEIFQYDLSEKDEILLKKQFDANKTLWILDGYDEIVQNVPPHLEYLFEQLLQTPHHIITSRPYMNTLSYDVQMEITGFTDNNIEKYVHKFFDQIKDELDDAPIRSQMLLKFLKSTQSIWGVAHIPVNLELICSLWSDEDWSETKGLTMTTWYTTMIEWLCRRYLIAQHIPIQKLIKNEVYQHCQKELTFLESLAFNAMESNTIILRPTLLEQAFKETKISFQDHPNILNIGILKSFNKQGIGTQIETYKDHYFIHLSFQEYFAARYLINALKGDSSEKAIEFIKHQKYNQRYALVFTFASGTISEIGATSAINIFWDTILGEPLDLVGIRHMQLVISCLEEVSDKSTVSRGTQLLQWIAKCIQYNLTTKNKIILKHISQSLQKAQSVLSDQTIVNVLINLRQYDDTKQKTGVLSFISELEISNPSYALIASVTAALNDKNRQLRANACKVLGQIGEKAATDEVISKLVSALGDVSEEVRANACQALERMGEKAATNEVISKVTSALEDKSKYIRANACATLGTMGEKAASNEVISKVVSALGDASEEVRVNACQALERMGEKAATNEVISKVTSALEDKSKYIRANACATLGTMGEKAATNEVISKLVRALGDANEEVRANACQALERIGEKAATNEVISKVTSALEDESKYVRASACQVLKMMGEKATTNGVISKLVNALEDENEYVRADACAALGIIGEKTATNEVINKLVYALRDESVNVRVNACATLGMMGENAATSEVISSLLSALGDATEEVRASSCQALERMGEKAATNEVISRLVSTLADKSKYVRASACQVLKMMGEKAATNGVISKLVNALRDESKYVRANACKSLGMMNGKAVTNEVINMLLNALRDESKYVRASACKSLKMFGGKAATNEVISKLVDALRDVSENVRANACAALAVIGEKAATNEVISRLVSALGDASEEVRMNSCQALERMGEKAATNEVISRLVSALADESKYVRANACRTLGMNEKAATNEVISKLVVLINSGDYIVSESAAEAVANIISSFVAVTQLDPKIVLDLFLSKHGPDSLSSISVDQLINFFFTTKKSDWLTVATRFAFLQGTAVTIIKDKVVLYGRKEPLEISIPSLQIRQQLIEAIIDQAKRLHLYADILSKDEVKYNGKKSEDLLKFRLNEDDQTTMNTQFSMNLNFRSRSGNADEYQNFVILCIGVELPDKNIFPTDNIEYYHDSFKFIARALSVENKTIYLIISTDKSHSIIPIVHKHYCIEKIYLYGSTGAKFTSTWFSTFEKTSGPYCDMKDLCKHIVNDIKTTAEKSVCWDRSFSLFTMLHTQQLENQHSVIEVSTGTPRHEYIVIFHYGDRKLFHTDLKSIPVNEFTNAAECLQLVHREKQSKIFLIISGSINVFEAQSIFDPPQIYAVYFFGNNEPKCPINIRKVSGSFDKLEELSEQLYKDILFYREQYMHTARIDVFPSIKQKQKLIPQLDDKQISFLMYNLFIDILPQTPLLEFKSEDLLKICSHLFPGKGEEIAHYVNQLYERMNEVKKFDQDPRFSQIVLKLHQLNQLNELFILQKPLIDIQNRLFKPVDTSKTDAVYLTKMISKDTLKIVRSSCGEFVSIGIFILATKSLLTARANARKLVDNGLISVLFQIELIESTHLCKIDSDRVIFRLGSVFRLESINLAPDGVYYVKIKSADSEFECIKEQLQFETEVPVSWLTYGNHLHFLKRPQQAKAYFKFLLHKLPSKQRDRPSIHNNRKLIYTMENGKNAKIKAEEAFDEALEYADSIESNSIVSESED